MDLYKKIKNDLQTEYFNKMISYEEFLKLYEPYKNELSEKDFAQTVKININSYYMIKKNPYKKAYIFREHNLTNQRKQEILLELKNRGYGNKKINLSLFEAIYKEYKNEMNQARFAYLLGISKSTYAKFKNGNVKIVTVLKTRKPSANEASKIILDLKNHGFVNKHITYKELLNLYEPYSTKYSIIDFSNILGISLPSLRRIQSNESKKAIMLETDSPSEELIKKIRQDLYRQGFENKLITYQEFLELFQQYKDLLKQTDFAGILGISQNTYYLFKLNKSKARILKEEEKEENNEALQFIKKDLLSKGYAGKSINYEEFLKLYYLYNTFNITQRKFAEILGITFNGYRNIVKVPNRKTHILSYQNLSPEDEEKIRFDLLKKGLKDKLIDYNEFLKLYEPYSDKISELQFLKAIQLNYGTYVNLKYSKQKTKILVTNEVDLQQKNTIIKKLLEKGYSNQLISYEQFLKLYEVAKSSMDEHQFADLLGISPGCYNSIKYQGTTTMILKTNDLPEETIDLINNQIISELHYINYHQIGYDEFMELYEKYKNIITKEKFGKILGFNQFHELNDTRETVIFNKRLFELIKYQLFLSPQKYTKKHLTEICEKNGITLYEFLCYLYKTYVTKRYDIIDELMQKDEIFLGIIPINDSFIEKYAEEIMNFAIKSSKKISSYYRNTINYEDIAIDTIMYVFQRKGSLVENAGNEKIALDKLHMYIYSYIKYMHLSQFVNNSKLKISSFDKPIRHDSKSDLYNFAPSNKGFSEESIINNIDMENSDDILTECKKLIDYGCSMSEIIDTVKKKYNLSQEEFIDILTEKLNKTSQKEIDDLQQ